MFFIKPGPDLSDNQVSRNKNERRYQKAVKGRQRTSFSKVINIGINDHRIKQHNLNFWPHSINPSVHSLVIKVSRLPGSSHPKVKTNLLSESMRFETFPKEKSWSSRKVDCPSGPRNFKRINCRDGFPAKRKSLTSIIFDWRRNFVWWMERGKEKNAQNKG